MGKRKDARAARKLKRAIARIDTVATVEPPRVASLAREFKRRARAPARHAITS